MTINKAGLLSVKSMPRVKGLDTPDSFYVVLKKPALLAGMCKPSSYTPWQALHRMGFVFVVCLTENPPDYDPDPLMIRGHFPLQDLHGGLMPTSLEAEKRLLYRAARMVSFLINTGNGVVVHCIGGTGRSGTVIGCVLKWLGYNTMQILNYLDQLNRLRGSRCGWPESEWQADTIMNFPVSRRFSAKNSEVDS